MEAPRDNKKPSPVAAGANAVSQQPTGPPPGGSVTAPASAPKLAAHGQAVAGLLSQPPLAGHKPPTSGQPAKVTAAPPLWHAGLLTVPQRGAARAADARLKGVLAAAATSKADDVDLSDRGREDRDVAAAPASKPRRSAGKPLKSRPSAKLKRKAVGVTKRAAAKRSGVGDKPNGQTKGKAVKPKAPVEQPAPCSRGRPIADVLCEQKV